MSIQVKIPTQLRGLTGGQKEIQVAGAANLREVLEKINADYPQLWERIVDETGEIRKFINVFVGDEDARFLQGLDTNVGESSVISILPAVAGG